MSQAKSIRRFVFKATFFFCLVIALDLLIGRTLEHFYYTQTSGLQYRTTYSIERTHADLLVFGSSRANHHYVPEIFEKGLKMSYYNVGRDGSFILYHYAVLKGILKRYKPKIIILDFNANEFSRDPNSYDRLSCLLPYYKRHPEMKPTIELRSRTEKYKLLSSIYPYNSSIFTIAIGNTERNKRRKQDDKGFIPLHGNWNQQLDNFKIADNGFDTVKVNRYRSFINDCLLNKIKLYIAVSPFFGKNYNKDRSIQEAQNIARTMRVDFFDFSADSEFLNNQSLFSDKDHLNNTGALIFSNKITTEILKGDRHNSLCHSS